MEAQNQAAAATTPRPSGVPAGAAAGAAVSTGTDAKPAAAPVAVPKQVMADADQNIGKLVSMLGQSEEQVISRCSNMFGRMFESLADVVAPMLVRACTGHADVARLRACISNWRT